MFHCFVLNIWVHLIQKDSGIPQAEERQPRENDVCNREADLP